MPSDTGEEPMATDLEEKRKEQVQQHRPKHITPPEPSPQEIYETWRKEHDNGNPAIDIPPLVEWSRTIKAREMAVRRLSWSCVGKDTIETRLRQSLTDWETLETGSGSDPTPSQWQRQAWEETTKQELSHLRRFSSSLHSGGWAELLEGSKENPYEDVVKSVCGEDKDDILAAAEAEEVNLMSGTVSESKVDEDTGCEKAKDEGSQSAVRRSVSEVRRSVPGGKSPVESRRTRSEPYWVAMARYFRRKSQTESASPCPCERSKPSRSQTSRPDLPTFKCLDNKTEHKDFRKWNTKGSYVAEDWKFVPDCTSSDTGSSIVYRLVHKSKLAAHMNRKRKPFDPSPRLKRLQDFTIYRRGVDAGVAQDCMMKRVTIRVFGDQ